MPLEIKGFQETSFLDWDGKVVSVIYLPFCNFRCPFCHNSGIVETPHEYETITEERVFDFLNSHKDFIDGVCITGGEPCLHKNNGLYDFMKRLKDSGFKVKLDTNGTDPIFVKHVIDNNLVDYIAMDIKAPLDERYYKLCGKETDISAIKETIKVLMSSSLPYEFRTTMVPNMLGKKEIEDIAIFIKGAKKYFIQQFVPKNSWEESLRDVKPYQKEELDDTIKAIKPYVENSFIRGA